MTDLDYLRLAYEHAIKYSTDKSTWNGAVLLARDHGNNERRIVVTNEFPRGVKLLPERMERPLKYSYTAHAEENAVCEAARNGWRTAGTTMYCPWNACDKCARAVIQAGITRLVGHDLAAHKTRPDWQPSIDLAYGMLREAGVQVENIPGEFGLKLLFDGTLIRI